MASEATALVNSASLSDLEIVEKRQWELSSIEETPAYLRSPDILSGYRVHFCLRLCLVSLVRLHNEWSNIHTHLFGCFAFVGTYVFLYVRFLSAMQSWAHFVIISLYVLAVSWLLFCSSVFHCFGCRSPASYACVARLDYSGIGLVILMSQWGAMTYAFVCWKSAFIAFATVLGFFTVVVVIGPMFKVSFQRRKGTSFFNSAKKGFSSSKISCLEGSDVCSSVSCFPCRLVADACNKTRIWLPSGHCGVLSGKKEKKKCCFFHVLSLGNGSMLCCM